jgi:hypothetical protein
VPTTLQATPQRMLVAGEPHPDLEDAAGYGLCQTEMLARLRIPMASDTSRYNPVTHEYEHDAAAAVTSYANQLPRPLHLPCGAVAVVSSTKQLCRLALKRDCTNKAHVKTKSAVCRECSLQLHVRVVDVHGKEHTLTELGYVSHGHSEGTEVITALLYDHAAEMARAGEGACLPCLPAWFCLARPTVRKGVKLPDGYAQSYKTEVSPSEVGFTTGAHVGYSAFWPFACGFLGPNPLGGEGEDGLCGSPLFVGIKPGDPHHLHVVLSATPHRHAAGACAKVELHAGGEFFAPATACCRCRAPRAAPSASSAPRCCAASRTGWRRALRAWSSAPWCWRARQRRWRRRSRAFSATRPTLARSATGRAC